MLRSPSDAPSQRRLWCRHHSKGSCDRGVPNARPSCRRGLSPPQPHPRPPHLAQPTMSPPHPQRPSRSRQCRAGRARPRVRAPRQRAANVAPWACLCLSHAPRHRHHHQRPPHSLFRHCRPPASQPQPSMAHRASTAHAFALRHLPLPRQRRPTVRRWRASQGTRHHHRTLRLLLRLLAARHPSQRPPHPLVPTATHHRLPPPPPLTSWVTRARFDPGRALAPGRAVRARRVRPGSSMGRRVARGEDLLELRACGSHAALASCA